jgi:transposase
MLPTPLPTVEEIRAVYRQGEEATVALFEHLVATIRALEARIQALENQRAKDSHNSGKPPSSDGLKKVKRGQRRPSGKKTGGQVGHPPHQLVRVPNPKYVKVHPVEHCDHCHVSLAEVPVDEYEKRQVFDLPEQVQLEVTEHQAEIKTCPICGQVTEAAFPADVTHETQYGARIRAQMVYFNEYQHISLERTAETIQDLYQQPVADGTIVRAAQTVATKVTPVWEQTKSHLTHTEDPVGFDETGVRINGKLNWLHVASSETATLYDVQAKRGVPGIDRVGILPERTGWSIHDYWKPYLKYTQSKHSLCNAHHIRDLIFIVETTQQTWASQMLDLLLKIKQGVETAKEQGQTALSTQQITDFEAAYAEILTEGFALNPTPERPPGQRGRLKQSNAKNMLDRLSEHREKVLAFMYDFNVPFDNNLAERDLRMVKVKQKVSGGFRSDDGAKVFCKIRSYISTARKNGQPVLDVIYQALTGPPYQPPFLAEQVAE